VRRIPPNLLLGVAVVLASFVISDAIGATSRPWERAVACLRAHGEKVVKPRPGVLPPGFHPLAAYFVTFSDLQKDNVGGAAVIEHPSAFVAYATSPGAVPALERSYARALRMGSVPISRFHFDVHGAAFVQWNPAPRSASDRRIVVACLGPATPQ
jgi:hypothetical protein